MFDRNHSTTGVAAAKDGWDADFLKFNKFKENGDSCLPLLNIIGELLCLTTCTACTCIFHPSSIVLHFSVLAHLYSLFLYLHFPSLHSRTCIFIRPPPDGPSKILFGWTTCIWSYQ